MSCLPCVHASQVCGISDGHWGMLVPKVWTWTPGPPWVCGFLGSVHTGSWVCAGHLFTLGMTPTGELPNHRLCRCEGFGRKRWMILRPRSSSPKDKSSLALFIQPSRLTAGSWLPLGGWCM